MTPMKVIYLIYLSIYPSILLPAKILFFKTSTLLFGEKSEEIFSKRPSLGTRICKWK